MFRLRLFLLLIFFTSVPIASVVGCNGQAPSLDQTREKEVVGFVNADPVYRINIDTRIKNVVDMQRNRTTVFYQPSLDDLVAMNYVSLRREIRKVGLKQPAGKIDRVALEIAIMELVNEKIDRISKKIADNVSFTEIAQELNLDPPQTVENIKKGDIPEWDSILWVTEVGEVAEPLISQETRQVYFFKVLEKNTTDEPNWITAEVIAFEFPTETAKKDLEERIAEKWDIRITSGFYDSINSYFHGDLDSAVTKLDSFLSGKGRRDSFAHYFKSRLLRKYAEIHPDSNLNDQIKESIEKAIEHCGDDQLEVHYRYNLAEFLKSIGDKSGAIEQLGIASGKLRGDLPIAKKISSSLIELGDVEFLPLVTEVIEKLENQVRDEMMAKPREVEKKARIEEGSGLIYEDIDEIIDEIQQAEILESELEYNTSDY